MIDEEINEDVNEDEVLVDAESSVDEKEQKLNIKYCRFEPDNSGETIWPIKFILGDSFDRKIFLDSFKMSLKMKEFKEDKRLLNSWKEMIAKTFHESTEALNFSPDGSILADKVEAMYVTNEKDPSVSLDNEEVDSYEMGKDDPVEKGLDPFGLRR